MLPRMCYPAAFGRSRSNGTGVIKEIRLENLTLTSGLSRLLDVIESDMDRFHSNHGPISYRFRDKRRFQSTVANFFQPRVFSAPA